MLCTHKDTHAQIRGGGGIKTWFRKEFTSDLLTDFPIKIKYGTVWVIEKDNENREKLANTNSLLAVTRLHCISWFSKKEKKPTEF